MKKLDFKMIKSYDKQLNETASSEFVKVFKEFQTLVKNVFEQPEVAKSLIALNNTTSTVDQMINAGKQYIFVSLYDCLCYLIIENSCYTDITRKVLQEAEYSIHPDGDISGFLNTTLEENCKAESNQPYYAETMIINENIGAFLDQALIMLAAAANIKDNNDVIEKVIDLYLYLIELTQMSMSSFSSTIYDYICNYEKTFKTQYDEYFIVVSVNKFFKDYNIATEYHVDGKVKCTRHNFDNISGVEEFNNLTGKLTISKQGFFFEADTGKKYKIDFLKFSKIVFENSNERSKSLNTLSYDKPTNDYEIESDYMFLHNIFDKNVRELEYSKHLYLYGLTKNQIKQITDICSVINDEVELDYQEKLQVESNIITYLKESHKNELVSFIEQFSDELFLNLKCYWIIFVHMKSNLFKRKHDDIPRIEFPLDSNPERTQKITDIKFVDHYNSFVGMSYPEMQLSSFDTQFCDGFLNSFCKLAEYFAPEIENRINDYNYNADFIDPFFIVWEALFETVIQYYHDYCIDTLGFNDFDGYYDRMIDYMSSNDLTSSKEIMAATYYEMLENDYENSVSNIYERIFDNLTNHEHKNSIKDFARALKNPTPKTNKKSIFDVDLMSGLEFEQFVAELFERKGYKAEVTKASGDQGIDVIAEKGGKKIGIQAKCYSGTVGNSAIQEAVAGKQFYRCDKAMVITNNYFTPSAIELAAANDVVLWNRDILSENMK